MADNDSDNESFCLVDSDNSDDDDESWSESDEEDHTVNNHNAEPLTTSEPAQELGDQSTKSPEPEDPDDKFSALQWMRTWPSSVLSMLVHTTEKSEKNSCVIVDSSQIMAVADASLQQSALSKSPHQLSNPPLPSHTSILYRRYRMKEMEWNAGRHADLPPTPSHHRYRAVEGLFRRGQMDPFSDCLPESEPALLSSPYNFRQWLQHS